METPSPTSGLTTDLPAGLSQPALRALRHAGYHQLAQVATATEADLLRLHGVGPKTIALLRPALAAQHLAFAPTPRPAEPR